MFNELFILFVFSCLLTYLSSTTIISYPSYKTIVDSLTINSTLPSCEYVPCLQTRTQANFTHINVSDDDLMKLSSYEKLRRPYLITTTGIYRGKRLKYSNGYVDQFLGIYYAEVPRPLNKPVKKIFNYSLQNATKFSPSCLQSLTMASNLSYGSFAMRHNFNENCLSLNIYRADLRSGERRKAIMLFSHGGSNQLGSGSLFDGSILASEGDLIVITMNFRLNYHGFLSSGDNRVKGNYGLWDQLLAVEWIYENAHLFGGDRNRIVLAGHSAGAGNVMLIPASPHCRGMIRRVISQSGTGLAPWSINHNPLKLLESFSKDFNCQRLNDNDTIDCVQNLLRKSEGDIYRLHLSLNIADDNPYPVIDHDFINDTVENILQSDAYRNVDFLTGVTLNEGLYFAEYHIKHLYNDLQNQTQQQREKHSGEPLNTSIIISPDITLNGNQETKNVNQSEAISNPDPNIFLEHFVQLNYIERYINANFQNGKCFIEKIRERYKYSAKDNRIDRLKLYIDLVSDLMFNFHMVHCLNLRAKHSTNYAYIYSHRPTYKVRSVFRDQLKILPDAVGHFAELDYVFGVPLAKNYSRIHQNVNMSYYNYSKEEEDFSRKIIRYWSNFIKTGNPNRNSISSQTNDTEWRPYSSNEHNFMFFQLNSIHNERNYFDRMYKFWTKYFHVEKSGHCQKSSYMTKRSMFLVSLILIFVCFLCIYFLWKCFQKKNKRHLETNRSPSALIPAYPSNHLHA